MVLYDERQVRQATEDMEQAMQRRNHHVNIIIDRLRGIHLTYRESAVIIHEIIRRMNRGDSHRLIHTIFNDMNPGNRIEDRYEYDRRYIDEIRRNEDMYAEIKIQQEEIRKMFDEVKQKKAYLKEEFLKKEDVEI